jgi:Sec-independent protein translocase protein TatA
MLAIFDNLGFFELMIVLVAAILIFGKRLPEVASQAGQQLVKFRRSLEQIKTETNIDNEIRKIQRDIQSAVPRDLSMGEMARIASAEIEKRMRSVSDTIKSEVDAATAEVKAPAAEQPAAQVKAPAGEQPAALATTSSSTGSAAAPGANGVHATDAPTPSSGATHEEPPKS